MELEQHVTFARVLLSVSVAGFDVTVRLRRELGEGDEAWMLDVLSLTLGDQVEASVQVDQLLDQLHPGRLLLPCLGLPGLRQSFPDRAVQHDPPLYLRNILEHIESNVDPQRSLQERRQTRLFPDHPHFVGYQECARVPRDVNLQVSWDNYRRKPDLLCTTWD